MFTVNFSTAYLFESCIIHSGRQAGRLQISQRSGCLGGAHILVKLTYLMLVRPIPVMKQNIKVSQHPGVSEAL